MPGAALALHRQLAPFARGSSWGVKQAVRLEGEREQMARPISSLVGESRNWAGVPWDTWGIGAAQQPLPSAEGCREPSIP